MSFIFVDVKEKKKFWWNVGEDFLNVSVGFYEFYVKYVCRWMDWHERKRYVGVGNFLNVK